MTLMPFLNTCSCSEEAPGSSAFDKVLTQKLDKLRDDLLHAHHAYASLTARQKEATGIDVGTNEHFGTDFTVSIDDGSIPCLTRDPYRDGPDIYGVARRDPCRNVADDPGVAQDVAEEHAGASRLPEGIEIAEVALGMTEACTQGTAQADMVTESAQIRVAFQEDLEKPAPTGKDGKGLKSPTSSDKVSEELRGNSGAPIAPNNSDGSETNSAKQRRTLSSKSKLQLGKAAGESDSPLMHKAPKELVKYIVTHDKFEGFIATMIMANALILCFEVQYYGFDICYKLKYKGCEDEATVVWPGAIWVFQAFDILFGLMFTFEMLAKLSCFGYKYFCDCWNYLDSACVVAFFIEKSFTAALPLNSKSLRLLRLFRLLRLVRLLRTLESLDHLYIMTTAMRGMTMVLIWAVTLLTFMLVTCALFLTQILQAYYFKDTSAAQMDQTELIENRKFYEYFGTFTRCLLSMFELTLANWPPVTRLLTEGASEWFTPLCLVHKITIGFAVIGVINGVILQETFKVASTDDWVMVRQKKRAGQTMRTKMVKLFDALDQEGDGEINFEEFTIIAEIPEVKAWLASMDVETDDLATLFSLIDEDGSGSITVDEMSDRLPRIQGAARCLDVLKIRQDIGMSRDSLDKLQRQVTPLVP